MFYTETQLIYTYNNMINEKNNKLWTELNYKPNER